MKHNLGLKFHNCNEKNMTFLLIPVSQKKNDTVDLVTHLHNLFQSDILYPRSHQVTGHRLKVKGLKMLHIPYSRSILLCSMLRNYNQHNYTYTMLKLIQMRVEDDQRWWQIQNPMPSPRQHIMELMVISMPSGRQHVV